MTAIMDKIKLWPRSRAQGLIFKSSEDAVYYGALISNHLEEVRELKVLRAEVYRQIDLEKQRKAPNFQRLLDLAVKGQFLREAYEEAERISNRKKPPLSWTSGN